MKVKTQHTTGDAVLDIFADMVAISTLDSMIKQRDEIYLRQREKIYLRQREEIYLRLIDRLKSCNSSEDAAQALEMYYIWEGTFDATAIRREEAENTGFDLRGSRSEASEHPVP